MNTRARAKIVFLLVDLLLSRGDRGFTDCIHGLLCLQVGSDDSHRIPPSPPLHLTFMLRYVTEKHAICPTAVGVGLFQENETNIFVTQVIYFSNTTLCLYCVYIVVCSTGAYRVLRNRMHVEVEELERFVAESQRGLAFTSLEVNLVY